MISNSHKQDKGFHESNAHYSIRKIFITLPVILILLILFVYILNREERISLMSDLPNQYGDKYDLEPELPEGLKPDKPPGSSYWYYPTAVLTKEILSRSRIISYKIKDIDRLLTSYGGQKKDWIKKSSEVLLDKKGRSFEFHWYENANRRFAIKAVPLD